MLAAGQHADKHLTVSSSLLGQNKIPVYYQLLSQSAAYHSLTALLSAQPRDNAPAAVRLSMKKINICSASTMRYKAPSRARRASSEGSDSHIRVAPLCLCPWNYAAVGLMIIPRAGEVSEVRESVSERNRGGPVTILFVLGAWDWSLVFDTMRASAGPSAFTLAAELQGVRVSPRSFFSRSHLNPDFNLREHFCCSFVTHMIPLDMHERAQRGRYWLTSRDLNSDPLSEQTLASSKGCVRNLLNNGLLFSLRFLDLMTADLSLHTETQAMCNMFTRLHSGPLYGNYRMLQIL